MKHLTPLALAASLLLAATGCASYRPFQIEPVSKKGTIVAPTFTESTYYVDHEQTLYFVMHSHTVDKATKKAVDQFATFRVFWRPVGGRTTMNSTALNATYRYILMTPDSVGMYEGAGFVRLWKKTGAGTIYARLMDGDLRLTESTANFKDTIGRSRVRGNFHAKFDDARTLDALLAARREFFSRSLKKIAPTTEPGSTTRPAPVDFPTSGSVFPTTEPTIAPDTTQP